VKLPLASAAALVLCSVHCTPATPAEEAAIDVGEFLDGAVCRLEDKPGEPGWAYFLCSFTGQPVASSSSDGGTAPAAAVTIQRHVRVKQAIAAAFAAKHKG